MKTLYVLRHAKTERTSASGNDFDRVLTERGEKDASAMGKALRKLGDTVDRVYCSPAARAKQTAELVHEKCPFRSPIVFVPALYLAEGHTLLRHLIEGTEDADDSILFVGHNPGLEVFVSIMMSGSQRGVCLPTGGFAKVQFDVNAWEDASARTGGLIWLINPEVVHAL